MEIPASPMLKPWYRVLAGGGRVLLEFGGTLVVLDGGAAQRLLPALLPLLDGTRTAAEIVVQMGEAVEPAVWQALETLAKVGAITGGPPLPPSVPRPAAEAAALVAAASPVGASPALIVERLEQSRVGLLGDVPLRDDIAHLLHGCGVGWIEPLEGTRAACPPAGLDLVVAADAARESLEQLNRSALVSGVPWLPTLPFDGFVAWVGPFIIPGESCCWRCFRLRRASTSGYPDELAALESVQGARLTPPPLAATVAGLTATVALRWLAARDPALPGTGWALELWPRLTLAEHVAYRVPRCPECSGLAGQAAPAPWAEDEAA